MTHTAEVAEQEEEGARSPLARGLGTEATEWGWGAARSPLPQNQSQPQLLAVRSPGREVLGGLGRRCGLGHTFAYSIRSLRPLNRL